MTARFVPLRRTVPVELDQAELHLILESLVSMATTGAHAEQSDAIRRKLQSALFVLANGGHQRGA
jgi:hypothetical protein